MGEPVSKMVSWARREKDDCGIVCCAHAGARNSDRYDRVWPDLGHESVAFAGKGATPLAMPDAIPSSNSFASIVNRVEPRGVNISTTR